MCLYPVRVTARPRDAPPFAVTVSCGKCLECLRQKSYEWAFRICHEAKKYKENCFITLTYNDENLPSDGSVSRREVQLFMKRLRQELKPLRVRFFACGEYGKKRLRPHYHLIIFGWFPSDAWFWQNDRKAKLYRSPTLEKVWTKGFSSVGRLSFDSALYCAKYMNKFQFRRFKNERGDYVLPNELPPFVQMSNRPGIGFDMAFSADLVGDRIYINGRSCKIPRYYLKVLEREGVYLDDFKERRMLNGQMIADNTDIKKRREQYKNRFLLPLV